jgi:hypothetical protein
MGNVRRLMRTADEALFIKCFESHSEEGRARLTPHSASIDPDRQDKPPRQSIEMRALVFYPVDE